MAKGQIFLDSNFLGGGRRATMGWPHSEQRDSLARTSYLHFRHLPGRHPLAMRCLRMRQRNLMSRMASRMAHTAAATMNITAQISRMNRYAVNGPMNIDLYCTTTCPRM